MRTLLSAFVVCCLLCAVFLFETVYKILKTLFSVKTGKAESLKNLFHDFPIPYWYVSLTFLIAAPLVLYFYFFTGPLPDGNYQLPAVATRVSSGYEHKCNVYLNVITDETRTYCIEKVVLASGSSFEPYTDFRESKIASPIRVHDDNGGAYDISLQIYQYQDLYSPQEIFHKIHILEKIVWPAAWLSSLLIVFGFIKFRFLAPHKLESKSIQECVEPVIQPFPSIKKKKGFYHPPKSLLVCAAVSIVLGILSIYLYYQCMDLEAQVAGQKDTISGLYTQIDAVEVNRDFYKAESEKYKKQVSEYRPKAQFLDDKIALIVEGDYTYAYHTYDCYIFKNSTYFYAYNIEAAEARGYSPCKICH